MNTTLKLSVFICVCLWPAYGAVDYSKFSHLTPKHKSACNSCHKVPTKNWTKVSTFPDLADYPDHDACVSCHRAQFFKGARPVICSVCHSKTSPRNDDRYDFRKLRATLQFTIDFTHDRHQDVIALKQFKNARGSFMAHAASAPQNFNNCTICHAQARVVSKPPASGWIDAYVPPPGTFKAVPTDHSSCFNCHWKSQEPVAANCSGCHTLADTPFVPVSVPTRFSLKFMHEGGGEKKQHVAECTTCHINITATIRGLKPDVPITSCTECHNREGLRQDLNNELTALDKNRAFVCVYCHTSNIGRLDAPVSHYLIAQRPPLTRRDIK